MPLKGYKTITIKEASEKKLGKIKEVLEEKSKSSTAEKIIDEKYDEVVEDGE